MGLLTYALGIPEHNRARKEQLQDEDRRNTFKELSDQQISIRDNAKNLGLTGDALKQAEDQVAKLDLQRFHLYHPSHSPGALQRDWDFLKGFITRKKPQPESLEVPQTPFSTTATPDLTFTPNMVAAPAASPVAAPPPQQSPQDRNKQWAKPGPYQTQLTPQQEAQFQQWAKTQPDLVKGELGPMADYDVRGRWLAEQHGDPQAKLVRSSYDGKLHANDKWKTPYHRSFSRESIYAQPNAPQWKGQQLVDDQGNIVFDESKAAAQVLPEPDWDADDYIAHGLPVPSPLAAATRKAEPGPLAAVTRKAKPGPPEAVHLPDDQSAVTLPGKTYNVSGPEPKLTSYQRKLKKQQEDAQQRTKVFMQAGPLTAEQEAETQLQAQLAKINILDKLPGITDEEKQAAKTNLMYAALGITKTPKYFSQPVYTKDASGNTHAYRVPMDPAMQAEEIVVGEGEQPMAKTGGSKVSPGMSFDKTTGQVLDKSTGKRYNEGDPTNPPEAQAMFKGHRMAQAETEAYNIRLTKQRGESYNASKAIQALDTLDGNKPTEVRFDAFLAAPGRYLPANAGAKALTQANLFEEIARVSRATRDSINNLKEDFPEDMKAKIAFALTAEDHGSAMREFLASNALGQLAPDQYAFLVATRQLTENAMAMRSVLGVGQSSDQVRAAIEATLPSLLTPNRSYALMQLDAFDKTLEQLHKSVPNVSLNETRWNVVPPKSKGNRSISLFKKAWQAQPENRGKTITDDEAKQLITQGQYTPTP